MRTTTINGSLAEAMAIASLILVGGCGGSGGSDSTTSAPAASAPPPPETTAKTQTSPGAHPGMGDGVGGVKLSELGQFEAPVFLTQPPGGGDLFVVEQGGTVRMIDERGKVLPTPFLDVSEKVVSGGEQGLLSLAFAPDYAKSGLFYVDYTDTSGDTHVVEYRRSAGDPLVADPASARDVLTQDQPFENHNGGLVLFGPDNNLYIGFGDGGSAGDPQRNGQDLGTFLGKILRIDPAQAGERPYSVPADNPFVKTPGAKPEIYLYGVRNPWRFTFDRETAALTIGDVGQSAQEEVDILPPAKSAGANLGWSAFEGTTTYNDDQRDPSTPYWFPQLFYTHDEGCSITGGYVVRDPALTSLYGRYLYGDFCAGDLRSFIPAPGAETGRDDSKLGLNVPSLSSFGEDAEGRIYALSVEGAVYRLDPS